MGQGLKRFKPGVERSVHLVCAAGLWTAIGIFLIYRGISYLKSAELIWLIVAGIILGTLKSRLILDRAALKGVARIRQFADNTCIGAVYSWKTWILVAAMICSGIWLRKSSVPSALIGTLLIGVGWALLFSSRHAWLAWIELLKQH
jgi:hypothetical protein